MRSDSWLVRLLVLYGTRFPHRGQERIHAALRRLLRVSVNETLRVRRGGMSWLLNPADFVQASLFWYGDYDRWDVHHFTRLVRPGTVVFDVGANFGYYAIAVARRLGGNGMVYAFEPFPPNRQLLATHLALNGLEQAVTVVELGLSDVPGRAVMTVAAGNSGSATMANPGGGTPFEVATTTLDAFCSHQGIARVGALKIDVEGFEERVLTGGMRTIAQSHPLILIELDQGRQARAGSSVLRVTSLLERLGYDLFVARRDRLVPLLESPSRGPLFNAFAIPRTAGDGPS